MFPDSAMQMEPLKANHSRSDPAGPAAIRQGRADVQSIMVLQSEKAPFLSGW
jgi:hypothetical protein